ncbi:unnamed protein product [Arctogadus glacialis]
MPLQAQLSWHPPSGALDPRRIRLQSAPFCRYCCLSVMRAPLDEGTTGRRAVRVELRATSKHRTHSTEAAL